LRNLAGVSEESLKLVDERVEEGRGLTSEMIETPIENLDLSVRVFNSLKRTGITTVGEVLELLEKGDEAVMSIRNFGEKSLDELRQKMREKGYLRDESESEVE
jgi:DNA-directed RNA polymerase subunit alpha